MGKPADSDATTGKHRHSVRVTIDGEFGCEPEISP
jgi:hypothetical protein